MKKEFNVDYDRILRTKNYSMFKRHRFNRTTNERNVNNLAISIKAFGIFSPILVNPKFEICEGQHRFLAAQLVGAEVPYIICPNYTDDMVRRINWLSWKWNANSWIETYLEDDNYPEYKKFVNIMKDYPKCTWTSGLKALGIRAVPQGEHKMTVVQMGQLVVDEVQLRRVLDICTSYGVICKEVYTEPFVVAIRKLLSFPKYDHEYASKKFINKDTEIVIPAASRVGFYLHEIEKLYNKGVKPEDYVPFSHL